MSFRNSSVRLISAAAILLCGALHAQVPETNVNMVSGTQWPTGDPFLQRQNEPSMAVSSRNPLHLLAGGNDYRTVDIPFPPDDNSETGDAWLGWFKSTDGGRTWHSNLIPGYPQDQSAAGLASPLKAFNVGTDPTVRAGTHGLFYYSGLAFNRGNKAPSGVFVSVFQDQNNKGNGDPIAYLQTTLVNTGTAGQFNDKPGMAVGIPMPGTPVGAATCTINGTTITTGKVYVAYTDFTGNQANNPHSKIWLSVSSDCGQTWSQKTKLNESNHLSQSPTIAIDPGTGAVYVAWRDLASKNAPDDLMYAKSTDGGNSFTSPEPIYTFAAGAAFDQGSSSVQFRTIAFPAITVDPKGRVYAAWSQRGKGPGGDARIMISTLPPGSTQWTTPYVADPTATGRGHQFLPALTSAFGRIMLVFYDLREDATSGVLQCPQGATCKTTADFVEVRIPQGDLAAGHPENVFTPTVADYQVLRRHTLDVRGALVDPSQFNAGLPTPLPFPSVQISRYRYGSRPGSRTIEQLQFNPPNFPMFAHGTTPFIGDFIDVAGSSIVTDATGKWVFNTSAANAPVFHAVWTDNRDVRPPPVVCTNGVCAQNWAAYTPVGSTGGTSLYDPTQSVPACIPNVTGSKNQNLYTSRITQGLVAAVKENSKSLLSAGGAPLQRAFSVFVQNNTFSTAYYRLTINTPLPANTAASFLQFSTLLTLDVTVLPISNASRSVFVTSSSNKASVSVTVAQITGVGGSLLPGGLQTAAVINPDVTNPDVTNPDVINPDVTNPDVTNPDVTNPDVTTAEVYNPTVTNPDVTNPDVTNPDVTNPDVTNPDVTNPDVTNPDVTTLLVTNPDVTNPDVTNPDVINPDVINPDVTNPDVTNLAAGGGATDFTWRLTNKGNTTSSYNAKLFLRGNSICCPAGCPGGNNCPQSCFQCQLILRRVYSTPVANACTLTVETQNIPVSSIPHPTFAAPGDVGSVDNSSTGTNGTLSLGPGEGGRVTLRVFGLTTNALPPSSFKPVGIGGGANSGQTTPAASLILNTVQIPVVIAQIPYTTTLNSVGGEGTARLWTILQGTLPAGLTLNPNTGVISGTATTPGSYDVTFQVQDSPAPPTTPQIDKQTITIQVNQLLLTSVVAFKTGFPGNTTLKTGDFATVNVTVSNAGPAAATSVAPTIQIVPLSGTANAAGCSVPAPLSASVIGNTNQLFTYSCGPISGDGNLTFTAQASAQYINTVATVSANTGAPVASNPLDLVDSTPPTITASATANGSPYTAGVWTNQSVIVTFGCVDYPPPGLPGVIPSGVATNIPGSATLTGETPVGGTNVSDTCTDVAGNVATSTFGPVKIDKTPPTLAYGAQSPAANGAGWNNTSVSFPFSTADNLSGVAGTSIPSPLVLAAEGSAVTGSVTVTDIAGNSATFVSPAVKIDKTAPVITFSGSNPPANGAGWNNTNVTLTWTCADSLSGPVAPSVSQTITTEGANQPSTGICTDIAGNTSSNIHNVSVDKTPPTAVITAPANGATYFFGSSITVNFTCADLLSGVASCVGTQPNGSTLTFTQLGLNSFTVKATDVAGNTFTAIVNYIVALPAGAALNFLNAPNNTTAGQIITPAIQVKAQTSGAVPIPGADITISVNSNPYGGALTGTTTVLTDATGVATFSNLVLDRSGSNYQLVASALNFVSSGAIQYILPPPSVEINALENNTLIRMFQERQGFPLPTAVGVDATTPGTYNSNASLTPGSVAAGTVADVYYLHADPVGAFPASQSQAGSITFSNDILGVIVLDPTFFNSDTAVGAAGTTYPFNGRGLELGSPDTVTVSSDHRTLTLSLANSTASDDVRVITAAAPVPATIATSSAFSSAPLSGFISTVAGSQWTFPAGTGPATSFPLGLAFGGGMAADAAGNTYVPDGPNNLVFKISSTGQLSIFAGTGKAGFTGDGPATTNLLNFPTGAAVDAAGNVYISDSGNQRVRKVSGGNMTTIAGNGNFGYAGDNGPATSASLAGPQGLALDSSGNLYIADFNNNRIRKVSGGVITTVAGNGAFGFTGDNVPATTTAVAGPRAVQVDGAGNIYIADTLNERVREVTAGLITTIVGTGVGGSSPDGPALSTNIDRPSGLAFDGGGHLLFSELGGHKVRSLVGTNVVTVAGNGQFAFADGSALTVASLAEPTGLAADGLGNIYIVDGLNERIRKLSGGNLTTWAGNGLFKYAGDGLAATNALLDAPNSVAVDGSSNIYIADVDNQVIRLVNSAGTISTFAGTGQLSTFVGDGGPPTAAPLSMPSGVAVSGGNVYITDTFYRGRTRKVSSGVISTIPVDSAGLAVDSAGNVYVADRDSNTVKKITMPAGTVTTLAGTGVAGYSGDNGPATSAMLNFPAAVAVDAAGNVYIADRNNNRIRKIDTSGNITTIAGTGIVGFSGDGGSATLAQLNFPSGVTVKADGSAVYIADTNNQRIRKITGATIGTFAGTGVFGFTGDNGPATNASLGSPRGVFLDTAGNVYITDTGNDRIRKVIP